MRTTFTWLGVLSSTLALGVSNYPFVQDAPSAQKVKTSDDVPSEVEDLLSESGKKLPSRPIDPEIRLATNMLKTISDSEQQWQDAWERLNKAVQAQSKQFNLFSEAETADSMQAYAVKLRGAGEELLKAYAELTQQSVSLKGALVRGPVYLRVAAATYDRYGKEETFEDIKKQYFDMRDIWLARAKLLEQRGSIVDNHYDDQLIPYLRDWNRFLDRLIPTLDYHFPFDKVDQQEYTRFTRQLAEHMSRLKNLTEAIGQWRTKALEQAQNPHIRQTETKAKTRAIIAPYAVSFTRDQRANVGALLEPPKGGSLFPQDTVLIVRPSPFTRGLRLVASAKVLDEPTKIGFLQNFIPSDDDFVLTPWAELPADLQCDGDIRNSLAACREANQKHAEIYSELSQLFYGESKPAEEVSRNIESQLYLLLKKQTLMLTDDASYRKNPLDPPTYGEMAVVFCNSKWPNPFEDGTRVTLYDLSTLAVSGAATVISKRFHNREVNIMKLKAENKNWIYYRQQFLFSPSGEQAVKMALQIDPNATIRAAQKLRDEYAR